MVSRAVTAALALLALAGAAHGQPIITPGLEAPITGLLDCRVVNGGAKPIDFVRRVFDFSGNAVVNPQGFLSNLPAHASSVSSSSDDDARYCVVEVRGGGRSKVRVTLSTRDATGTTLVAVEGR